MIWTPSGGDNVETGPQGAVAFAENTNSARVELVERELARRHLIDFACYVDPYYTPGPVHHFAAEYFEKWARGEIRHLMVMWPPRHGKSLLGTILLTAWLRGLQPDWPLMVASYSFDLARSFGGDILEVCGGDSWKALFPELVIHPKFKASDDWRLAQPYRGKTLAVGRGGAQTGKGFKRGIIDDPTKDAREAQSEAFQSQVWDWYSSTFRTRAEKDASLLVTMTRWHEHDLAGRLLERDGRVDEGGKWTVLKLPALIESESQLPDMMGRSIGDALWPAHFPYRAPEDDPFSLTALENIRAEVGPHVWSALYQQEPVIEGGNEFRKEWFSDRYMPGSMPELVEVWSRWDTSLKERDINDETAMITVGRGKDGVLYGVKGLHGHWTGPEMFDLAASNHREMVRRYGAKYRGDYVEDAAGGAVMLQWARKARNLNFIPVKIPKNSKLLRARSVAGFCESRRFRFPIAEIWADDFISQLCSFPNAANDDMVDVVIGAIEREIEIFLPKKKTNKRKPPEAAPVNPMTGY